MFTGAEKWINKINKDEHFKDYLAREEIRWKFNLANAPWWGGQFERMIGLTKQMLHQSLGNAHLTISEFENITLDIEINLNNRPLTYIVCQESDIPVKIIKDNIDIFSEFIFHNFNNSIFDAIFPSELKNVNVILVFKKKARNNI